jgi:hypothetical protein
MENLGYIVMMVVTILWVGIMCGMWGQKTRQIAEAYIVYFICGLLLMWAWHGFFYAGYIPGG